MPLIQNSISLLRPPSLWPSNQLKNQNQNQMELVPINNYTSIYKFFMWECYSFSVCNIKFLFSLSIYSIWTAFLSITHTTFIYSFFMMWNMRKVKWKYIYTWYDIELQKYHHVSASHHLDKIVIVTWRILGPRIGCLAGVGPMLFGQFENTFIGLYTYFHFQLSAQHLSPIYLFSLSDFYLFIIKIYLRRTIQTVCNFLKNNMVRDNQMCVCVEFLDW